MSLMWQNRVDSYIVLVSKFSQGSQCAEQGDCGKEGVPREESSHGNTLVYSYLNVNECEKRKTGSTSYRDSQEEAMQTRMACGRQD